MWFRINDTMVVVKSIKDDKVILRVFVCGELEDVKEFETEQQADTYIALQQRVNEPINCKDRKEKSTKIDDLKKIMKSKDSKKDKS